VSGLTFTAEPGAITGLLGPNGSGKTTVLKAVAGIHLATRGAVLVEGRDAAADSRAVRSLTGYAAENARLPPDFTVAETLSFAAPVALAFRGMSKAERREAALREVERAVETLALESVLSTPITHLSKGYAQRVSLALALLGDPPVLVLDEPASGLDPAQIFELRELLKTLGREKTVILSTHLIQEAEALCPVIVILREGRLVAAGSREDLLAASGEANLEKAYLALCAEADHGKA
jgi:ABC-2 type transport system ATP-binding protein